MDKLPQHESTDSGGLSPLGSTEAHVVSEQLGSSLTQGRLTVSETDHLRNSAGLGSSPSINKKAVEEVKLVHADGFESRQNRGELTSHQPGFESRGDSTLPTGPRKRRCQCENQSCNCDIDSVNSMKCERGSSLSKRADVHDDEKPAVPSANSCIQGDEPKRKCIKMLLYAKRNTELPANTTAAVQVTYAKKKLGKPNNGLLVATSAVQPNKLPILVGNALLHFANVKAMPYVNLTDRNITVKRGDVLPYAKELFPEELLEDENIPPLEDTCSRR